MIISNNSFKEYLHKEFSPYLLPKSIKDYLINLLCFYLNTKQLFEKKEGETKFHEKTLLDWYKKSQNSSKQEKLYLLKRMGDFSLYWSGFFRKAIKKKLVHLSYYEEMGRTAYHHISQSYDTRPNIFNDLSRDFREFSEILFSIQKQSVFRNQKKYFLNFSAPASTENLKNNKKYH